MIRKKAFLFFLLISFSPVFAQLDSSQRQGTIRIAKQKTGEIYVKALVDFGIRGPDNFQPFPVVEGFSFPFNYTKYFRQYFKGRKIDLQGKEADTVYLELSVSKKGKVFIRDISNSMRNGRRINFDSRQSSVGNQLHMDCMNALYEIKKWFPAYHIDPQVGKYKGQTVIRPEKINKDANGIVSVFLSTEPFD